MHSIKLVSRCVNRERKRFAMKSISLLVHIFFLLLTPLFVGAEIAELSASISIEVCSSQENCRDEELMPRQNIAIELEEIWGMEGTFTGSWSKIVEKGAFSFKGNISVTKSVYREGMQDPVTYFVTGWFKDGTVVRSTTQRLGDLSNLVDQSTTGSSVLIEGSSYTPTLTVSKKISEK